MSRIAVVIVNYNTRDHLRACLSTIPVGAEVVVVDNASTDDSVELVRREFQSVRLRANRDNPGYGSAANQGVRMCEAEYVLVLNSDTRLEANALNALQDRLDADPEVALVGPLLLNEDSTLQPSCFPFPGTLRWLLENEPVAPVLAKVGWARRRLLCFSPPSEATDVPWVLGAAVAVRRSAFEQVGGFDPSFFMYFEEVDLCRRLTDRGWRVQHVPAARIVHLGAASTSQLRAEMAVQHYQSTRQYYRRYFRGARLVAWLSMMRLKMWFRLLRDATAMAVTRETAARLRLREDVSGWRRALRLSR